MHRFSAELWRWDGNAAWHFVTVPGDISEEIRELSAAPRAGFGSVRVRVTIGATTWSTSVFPDSRSGRFVLPVKRQVRDRERIDTGDLVNVTLDLPAV